MINVGCNKWGIGQHFTQSVPRNNNGHPAQFVLEKTTLQNNSLSTHLHKFSSAYKSVIKANEY